MRNIWKLESIVIHIGIHIYISNYVSRDRVDTNKRKEKLLNKKIIFSDIANHLSLFSFKVIVNNSHTGSSDKIVKLKE